MIHRHVTAVDVNAALWDGSYLGQEYQSKGHVIFAYSLMLTRIK